MEQKKSNRDIPIEVNKASQKKLECNHLRYVVEFNKTKQNKTKQKLAQKGLKKVKQQRLVQQIKWLLLKAAKTNIENVSIR